MSVPRRAFTLIELMVVTALLALAVGVTTVHFSGLTYRSGVEDAAARIRTVLRLCAVQAYRTGLPQVVRITNERLVIRRPHRGVDGWEWENLEPLDLGRARVTACRRIASESPRTEPPWDVTIRPGWANATYRIALEAANGVAAELTIVPGARDHSLVFYDDN